MTTPAISGVYKDLLYSYGISTQEMSPGAQAQVTQDEQATWDAFCSEQYYAYETNPSTGPSPKSYADFVSNVLLQNPSTYAPLFAQFVAAQLSAAPTTDLTAQEVAKRRIMIVVFELAASFLQTLQNTMATIAPQIQFDMNYQNAYTNAIAQVPTFMQGETQSWTLPTGGVNISNIGQVQFGFNNLSGTDLVNYLASASSSTTNFSMPLADGSATPITTSYNLTTGNYPFISTNSTQTTYQLVFVTSPIVEQGCTVATPGQIVLEATTQLYSGAYLGANETGNGTQIDYFSLSTAGTTPTAASWTAALTSALNTLNSPSQGLDSYCTYVYDSAGDYVIQANNGSTQGALLFKSSQNSYGFLNNITYTSSMLYLYATASQITASFDPYLMSTYMGVPEGSGEAYNPGYAAPPTGGGWAYPSATGSFFVPWPDVPTTAQLNSTDSGIQNTVKVMQQNRADFNTQMQQYITYLQSQQQSIHDLLQGLQSNLSQAQELYNEQSTLLSTIIQDLQTIVSAICANK